MLLPTIKLNPQLESSLLDSLITNRFYLHNSGYSIFEIFGDCISKTTEETPVRSTSSTTPPIPTHTEGEYHALPESDRKKLVGKLKTTPNTELFYKTPTTNDFITNLMNDNIKEEYAYYFWKHLSSNHSAFELLLQTQDKMSLGLIASNTHPDAEWFIEKLYNKSRMEKYVYILSSNPRTIHLLQKYPHQVSFNSLILNPHPEAVDLIINHIDYHSHVNIWLGGFLQNETCMELFLQYLNIAPAEFDTSSKEHLKWRIGIRNFSWYYLSLNPHPLAIKILKLFPENIHQVVVTNPAEDAYSIIKQLVKEYGEVYSEIIRNLCKNTNPQVLELLNNYSPDLYDWGRLCENPSAIPILVKNENRNKIKITYLLRNPDIFVYNYANMRENISVFKEELMRRFWCPKNVLQWIEDEMDEFLES